MARQAGRMASRAGDWAPALLPSMAGVDDQVFYFPIWRRRIYPLYRANTEQCLPLISPDKVHTVCKKRLCILLVDTFRRIQSCLVLL